MANLVRIRELFEVNYGNQLDKNKMIENCEGIRFISRSSSDLGADGRVEAIPEIRPNAAGLITVTLGGTYLLSAFVQPEEFYTAQNIKVLTPKLAITFNQKAFYCLCISRNRFRYTSHGREANKTFDDILVPKLGAIPKWVEQISVESRAKERRNSVDVAFDVCNWRKFRLGDIFEIKKGCRLTKANMSKGATPFVGAIASNNGCREFVDVAPNHRGNTISINYNGSVAEAYYQSVPFWASDDVNVLYPRFKLTVLSGLFVCTLIRRERYRFNYGRKWHLERMVNAVIRLPVADTGEPDWGFVEQLMGSLPYSGSLTEVHPMTAAKEPKRGRGRPPKTIPKINVSPERVARAMFSAVKPPDPGKRVVKPKRSAKAAG